MKHVISLSLSGIVIGVMVVIFLIGMLVIAATCYIRQKTRRDRRQQQRDERGVTALLAKIDQARQSDLPLIALHITVRMEFNRQDRAELTCALRLRHLQFSNL